MPFESLIRYSKNLSTPKSYGIPYMGSKSRIAKILVQLLPPATTFLDLFAGGCSMTHAAILSKKYSNFVANDISDAPSLFLDAISGKYSCFTCPWISRDDFYTRKDSDPCIRYCYSFGNNGTDYLYSKEIEPYKKALHLACVFDDWMPLQQILPELAEHAQKCIADVTEIPKRRIALSNAVRNLSTDTRLYMLQHLISLERIQLLFEPYRTIPPVTVSRSDYRNVRIPHDAVVYCDPPYKNTHGYNNSDFNNEDFYRWALEQPFKIYISEYELPPQFREVISISSRSPLAATTTNKVTEKLFCNH